MGASETLKKAWAAVKDADLPESIHEVAFREAVRLLAPPPAATTPGPIAPGGAKLSGRVGTGNGAPTGDGAEGGGGIAVSEATIYDRVVAQTGVDREKLEQLVHLDGDVLKVSIPGLRLGKTNAERARSVAQILTITRGFGLEESETSLELIRAECDRLRVYDQNNFSGHVKALAGFVVTGTGANRRVRAKGPGIAAFPGIVDKLLGLE
ncbi:MAG: hypothetical protein L6367_05675 [Cellulomonas sp.]|nr:hypothetical protein [Cellulomonas sp.]